MTKPVSSPGPSRSTAPSTPATAVTSRNPKESDRRSDALGPVVYPGPMDFDDGDLFDQLIASSDAQLQDTRFGVVAMDADNRVVMYNRTESTLSGLSPERVVGRHFFSEVAPCTNNFMVGHRFENEEELDATIDYLFTLRMKPTQVRLRMLARRDLPRRFLIVQWS